MKTGLTIVDGKPILLILCAGLLMSMFTESWEFTDRWALLWIVQLLIFCFSPGLLEELKNAEGTLETKLSVENAKQQDIEQVHVDEKTFR